jgi:hypothetical protein
MTSDEKSQNPTVEGMQSHTRKLFNKGIGNVATCTTAGSTAAKEVTMGTTFNLVTGCMVLVLFQNAITVANATLAVTHTPIGAEQATIEAAKPIFYRGAALGANLIKAGSIVQMRYDGTNFNVIGDLTPSGFNITHNNTTGADQFEAIGSATLVHDTTTGADKFTF